MKKSTLIVATLAAALTMAACNNDKKDAGEYTQTQLDSILTAKADSQRLAEQRINDSMLQAESQHIADSIAANSPPGSTTTVTTKKTTVTSTKPPKTNHKAEPTEPPAAPKTVGNGKPDMRNGNNDGTVGKGKPSMRDNGSTDQNGDKSVGNGKPSMRK